MLEKLTGRRFLVGKIVRRLGLLVLLATPSCLSALYWYSNGTFSNLGAAVFMGFMFGGVFWAVFYISYMLFLEYTEPVETEGDGY